MIPTEDNRSSLERALEIISELGKDHINDIIPTSYGRFTALDYVIIADSQGNNRRLSARSRINNMVLVELENAIRNVEGRTSEESGLVQIEASTHREIPINTIDNNGLTALHIAMRNGYLDVVRHLIEHLFYEFRRCYCTA